MSVTVERDAGHPWSGVPGWDRLHLQAIDVEQLDVMISDAERKHWQVWLRDQDSACAMLFKPAGASAHWEDDPRHGTPRAKCLAIAVGDWVYTDYAGRITQHRVVERILEQVSGHMTQTGCQLRVTPPVIGSGYVTDDPNAKIRQKGLAWMDSAWFRLVE
jgi:hypothetical protein